MRRTYILLAVCAAVTAASPRSSSSRAPLSSGRPNRDRDAPVLARTDLCDAGRRLAPFRSSRSIPRSVQDPRHLVADLKPSERHWLLRAERAVGLDDPGLSDLFGPQEVRLARATYRLMTAS